MRVRDIMTTDLICADINDTLYDVAKLMRKYNIGCVPVLEGDEKVLGIITDRDIILGMAKYNKDLDKIAVAKVMTNNIYSVQPEAEVEQALDLMKKQQIRRLPVIENDILIGIVSIGDIATKDDCDLEISSALTEISKS